jgi:1-acyl-sn-glycerol-3-phosphate acyltransferase
VPIVPVAIYGSERVMPKGSHWPRAEDVHLVYGKPFHLPESMVDNRVAADYMMGKVAELLPVEYRGVYGGRPTADMPEALTAG